LHHNTKLSLVVAGTTVVSYVVLAFLVLLTKRELSARHLSQESEHWTPTPGTVLDSKVDWHSMGKLGSDYFPTVRYRFIVDRAVFISDRVSFSGYGSEERAKEEVAKYPPGTTVTVRFRPADPRESVLEPDSWDGEIPLSLALIGAAFFGCCAAGLTALLAVLWGLPVWIRRVRRRQAVDF
jgi:uncharacterized protein DUF3592